MRNLKLTRVLFCFAFVGDCQIYMERTTYFFWIPSTDAGYYRCDWGLTVDQLCA